MWIYEKKLEYPVNIKTPNPKLAMAIISQLGGPDGELGASQRYLSQRYASHTQKSPDCLRISVYRYQNCTSELMISHWSLRP